MDMPRILLRAREADEAVGGTAYGVRLVLAATFAAVLWNEYKGRVTTKAPWSNWTLLLSGTSLLASSILHASSHSYYRAADTLAALSTVTTKLYLAAVLHPAASSGARRLLQSGALLTALSAVPVVALGWISVEGLGCEGRGCFPAESWVALAGIVAGFSTIMDLAFVGIALRMTLKHPLDPRDRPGKTLAIACGVTAFIAGLIKLTKFAPLSAGNFTLHIGHLLLWTTAESSLTLISGTTIAPYTAHERVKRPRSPPTDDEGHEFGVVGHEERGEELASESELLRRSMVRAGLL